MLVFIPFVIYLWTTNLKKLNVYYNESKSNVNNKNYMADKFNEFDGIDDFDDFEEL